MPTASAVVADVVDYASGRAENTFRSVLRNRNAESFEVLPQESPEHRYYIRCIVDDRPHVLADVTDILGRHEVSISSLHQDEPESDAAGNPVARLVIMTHRTAEGRMRQADEDLNQLDCVRGESLRLPVAE